MILVDTSAWVEFFRSTHSATHERLARLVGQEAELAVTDAILMEVLAGARSAEDAARLRGALTALHYTPVRGPEDYEAAAGLHRACRARGETPRKLVDCLIAAVAIRAGTPVLHCDADFEVLARHTPLELA